MWGKVFTGPEMRAFAPCRPRRGTKEDDAAGHVEVGRRWRSSSVSCSRAGINASRAAVVQAAARWRGWSSPTLLWLSTIALSTSEGGVWYDKVRPLLKATFWSWLVRMNVGGLIVGLLVK